MSAEKTDPADLFEALKQALLDFKPQKRRPSARRKVSLEEVEREYRKAIEEMER